MIPSDDNMVKEESQIRIMALAVVRGEMPLDTLTKLGIDLDSQGGSYKLKSGHFDVIITPSASDVASGILRYSSGNKSDLRKWAFFMLAESGALDLSAVESHPLGELLISALWDASFEGHVSSQIIELAQHLTLRN